MAFVTQYDVETYQRLEALIGQKLPQVRLLRSAVIKRSIYASVNCYCLVPSGGRHRACASGAGERGATDGFQDHEGDAGGGSEE